MRKFRVALKVEEFEVELQDGTSKKYVMKEMDGTLRDSYNDAMAARMRKSPEGKPLGLASIAGIDADLLIRCVFDPSTEKMVDTKTVQSWSSTSLDEISEWALEFNGLNKNAEKNAKNDSAGSDDSGGK